MIEQTNALLNHEWTPDEKVLIKRLVESLLYYKYLIPKNLKSDIVAILDMANNIKHEYTILKSTTNTTNTTNITNTTNTTNTKITTINLHSRRNSCTF